MAVFPSFLIKFVLMMVIGTGTRVRSQSRGATPRGGSAISPPRSTGWGSTQPDARVRDGATGPDFFAGNFNGEGGTRTGTEKWTGERGWRANGQNYWYDGGESHGQDWWQSRP